MTRPDKRVDKRRVTMTNVKACYVDGKLVHLTETGVDYVRDAVVNGIHHLDAYVADARTRWQSVDVSAEYDAGPLGYDGPTHIAEHLKRGVTLGQHLHDIGELPLVDKHPVTGVETTRPGFGAHRKAQ